MSADSRQTITDTVKDKLSHLVGGSKKSKTDPSRRDFLRKTGAVAGAAAVGMSATTGNAAADNESCPWGRTDDSHLPFDTGGQYGGWGGADYWGTQSGVSQTPVVFVHGNTGDACNFNTIAEDLKQNAGYTGDELWAITFREGTTDHDEMKRQLDDFVQRVLSETGQSSVKLVGHSLGVTGIRYWMHEFDRYNWVESTVLLGGANHGVCVCPGCYDTTLGQDYEGVMGAGETCQFIAIQCFSVPGHPLYEINLPTETPGNVDYYTFRGVYDPLYSCNIYSPYLDGAENDYIYTDHYGLTSSAATDEIRSVIGGDATSSYWNWW